MRLEQCTAYEIEQQEYIKDVHAEGTLLRHKKTGARVLLLQNNDDNKVFNIAFRTPPANSTGVAHILEHSVLCGSRNFPLKDPFVELMKGSLNTFLNAMTYPDKTMYPVASCNDQDFQNLMHVYLDAVFYPNIYVREEIFRQEGWSYQLESVDDPLEYNGVVYNEMKGAFSSADEVLDREIFNVLFPDTPYGVESGGDPDVIPELTYEEFLAFHGKYYHPSNSYIYLYGNMDMAEKLNWIDKEYLSKFEKIEVPSEIALQEAFEEPKEYEIEYPISEQASDKDATYLSYNMVVANGLDVELCAAFEVLDYVLLSAPGAPLRQALLDAGIGKDIEACYNDGIYQPFFTIVAKNAEKEDKGRFVEIIQKTLEKISEEGVNPKAVEAAISSMEFKFREADFSSYPKGLIFGISAFSSWLYDDTKPFSHLKLLSVFEVLKAKAKQGYFEELIKEYLLGNPHTAVVVAVPKKGLALEKEKALEEKLAAYKATLSQEQLEELVEKTHALVEYQESEDSDEAKTCIPMLKREDIRKEAVEIPNTPHKVGDTTVLHHDVDTNGISYLTLLFDTKAVPDELISYMGILKSVLGMVDTKRYSYGELYYEINAQTGGIYCGIQTFNYKNRLDDCMRMFTVNGKYLTAKEDFVFDMMEEILFTSKFDDDKRLREIIARQKARLQTGLGEAGHATAITRASSYYAPSSYFNDRINGIEYYRLVEKLDENFEEMKEELKQNLKKLMYLIFRPENLSVSITTDEAGYVGVEEKVLALKEKLHRNEVEKGGICYKFEQKNEGFSTAGQVQYVAIAGNFKRAGLPYDGCLRILKVILSYDYLWMNIRVKGGAYGCAGNFRRGGDSFMMSYRDPNLKNTLDVFEGTVDYLKNFTANEREMTKYIIGTIGELDTPLNPSAKGTLGMNAWFSEITQDELQKERDEILNAQPEDIQKLYQWVQAIWNHGNVCVVGSESVLEKEGDCLKTIKPLVH